jgi:hypothetical protein
MDNIWTPGQEIWISAGRVRPDWTGVTSSTGWAAALNTAQLADKRNWGFVLKEGVKIYGGFEGTETATTAGAGRALRNPALHETVLSGDLGEAGNVKHVVIAVGVSAATRLEGLTISGGNCLIDTYDTTFRINGQSLTPSSGIYGGGGGFININASPWLHNVTFRANTALYGGAVFNWNSSPVLTNVTVSNCVTSSPSSNGGNVYNNGGGSLLMIGGSVSGNQGAAVFVQTSSSILINVTANRNSGDGVHYNGAAPPTSQKLINVTVTGNDSRGVQADNGMNLNQVLFNSVINGNASGGVLGGSGDPVNSEVNGVTADPENADDYWPVVNGALNTNSHYNSGGALYGVYTRVTGLPGDIKAEVLSLLAGLPARGAK